MPKSRGLNMGNREATHPSREMIEQYHDGELEDAARAEVSRHLERCSECAARLEESAVIGEVLRKGINHAVGAEDLDRLWEGIGSSIEPGRVESAGPGLFERLRALLIPGGRLLRPALAVAAAVILSVAILLLTVGEEGAVSARQCIVESIDTEEATLVLLHAEATDTTILWLIEEEVI